MKLIGLINIITKFLKILKIFNKDEIADLRKLNSNYLKYYSILFQSKF